MSALPDIIARYYDAQSEREWEREKRNPTEFAITRRALAEHLPPPPACVLDCGGGPGRYAIELARQGYEVTLFDLSPKSLQLAQEKAAEANATLAAYEQGTATDLSRFPDDTFDAVLLLGPLYHLLEEEERQRALGEARRVLKPGGRLFAAFISRYAVQRWAAANKPAWPLEHPELWEIVLTKGVLPPRWEGESSFVAHMIHPTEVVPLCQRAGFEVVTVLGVEGLVSMIDDGVNKLSGAAWDAWENLNYRVAADPSIHGCVEHLLAIAINPRWRAVLRRIVPQMDEAGIAYKVVGGASVALNGVSLAVKDLDIEMSAQDAHRFQALFADRAVRPVTLSESETYRSHFGRFDFDGMTVEIMGDLRRREGEGWALTMAATETTVGLDGANVRVPWLEEETLAYIRRGRLDRAALCLPHCDADRLLALLRGEQAVGVL